MFSNIQSAVVDANNDLQLTPTEGETQHVPRSVVQLILDVDALTVQTSLAHHEHGWLKPDALDEAPHTNWFTRLDWLKTVPYPIIKATKTDESMSAYGSAKPVDTRLYTFDKAGGFAEITDFSVRLQVAPEPCCQTLIYEGNCGVYCNMTEDHFVRLIKHVYLSAATWQARVVVGVIGFQNSAEAAFSEPGDRQHLILQGDRSISSELRSLSVFKT